MEISDDVVHKIEPDNPFEREVRTVFHDTLGLIHIALVTHYGMVDSEAQELEKDLLPLVSEILHAPGE